MDRAYSESDDFKPPSREAVNFAVVVMYSRGKIKGRWDEQSCATIWEYCRTLVEMRVPCPGDAREVLSRIIEKLFTIFERREHMDDPALYISRMITTVRIDHYRSKQALTNAIERAKHELVTHVHGEHYGSTIATTATFNEIYTELKRLTQTGLVNARDRKIFDLYFIDGCTLREIESHVHLKKSVIRDRLTMVVERLQKCIKRGGDV
jgi:RNA polymerase sigma factor (sigma-70 family)